MYDVYRIELGDSIDSLAQKYGTTVEILRSLNPNSSFAVGSNIIVPTTKEYFDMYTIEKGDTLYNIAKKYNTDYNLLALLNGINTSDYIYPMATILVPKKNIKYYLTKEKDTLFGTNKILSSDLNRLLRQNQNIYLKEGQLIVYKD